MLRLLKLELGKIFKPVITTTAILTVLTCILTCVLQRDYTVYFHIDAWEIGTEYIALLFPLFVTIPVCWQLYYERRDRFIVYTLSRISRQKYLSIKWAACALSGFCILFIPYVMSLLCALYVVTPANVLPPHDKYSHFLLTLYVQFPLIYGLLLSAWKALLGVLTMTFGFVLALFSRNIFVILTAPFVYVILENFILASLSSASLDLATYRFVTAFEPTCRVYINLGSFIVGPVLKQKWESFDTEAEAKHRKAEIEYKQGSRTFIAPSKTTVAAFLEDFVSLYGTKKWSPSTYEANTGLIRNYINPKLGSTLMQDVTSIAADRFISALQRTKCPTYKNRYSKTEYMTPANIERINKLLRCAFGQAVRWDIIAKNPFENTTLPKIKRKPREIWDAATIRKALDECKDGRLYVAINLSFACSLRIGEIVGLTWDNIHISDADIASDNAYLCVEKELVRVREDSLAVLGEEEIIKKFPRTMYLEDASTVIVLKTPKTESSVRKVWMPKTVAYILREWKASQDKQKEFLGSEYLDYNLVVALPNGRPCEETVISNAFRRLKRDAQLPDVVFHSLRHSSTTYKLKLNHGDIKATQGDTGHSQADMVTKVYAHILDEDRKVNAQKFESAFYANPDLRGVQAPAEPAPALDVQSIILQLQQSPELLSALTSLISNQGCK